MTKKIFQKLTTLFSFSSTSSYCSPNTPRRLPYSHLQSDTQLQFYPHPSSGTAASYHPGTAATTLHYNPAAFSSAVQYSAGKANATLQYNTGKKRTLVQYKYPDVLPSEKLNQNYYV